MRYSRRLPRHPIPRASRHLDRRISERQPTRWKVHTGIWDTQGFIIEPTFRLLSLLVEDLIGLILVPVIGLRGIRVRDAFGIHPIFGLLILRIINLSGWVDSGSEILEEVTAIDAITIDQDVISIIGAGRQLIQWCEDVTIKTDCRTSV